MKYASLFDQIHLWEEHIEAQRYRGYFGRILDELLSIAGSTRTQDNVFLLLLHPPRLIRGVLDYQIENSVEDDLLERVVQLGLMIYRDVPDVYQKITRFKKYVETVHPKMLEWIVDQPEDRVTWKSTAPPLLRTPPVELVESLGRKTDVLLIALAHGSVAAGLDIYLRYKDISKSRNSVFYPVRFSRRKLGDEHPQLTSKEMLVLQEWSKSRRVVVFDDDMSSGRTLRDAENYFTQVLKQAPLPLVCRDNRHSYFDSF